MKDLIAKIIMGVVIGTLKGLSQSGVDTSEVKAGLQDALAQITLLDLDNLAAQEEAEWAKLRGLLGGGE